jgi:hypothetical protein
LAVKLEETLFVGQSNVFIGDINTDEIEIHTMSFQQVGYYGLLQ